MSVTDIGSLIIVSAFALLLVCIGVAFVIDIWRN